MEEGAGAGVAGEAAAWDWAPASGEGDAAAGALDATGAAGALE